MGTLNSDPEDSFAITLASNSQEATLVAITVVQGNVPLRHGYANAKHLLELLGISGDIDLAAGASTPVADRDARPEQYRWLDEKDSWERKIAAIDAPYPHESAVETIRRCAEQYDDLVIAAIGPLTNIAAAIREHPHIVDRISRLVVMGGAFEEPGNITPTAEFNFFMDPEAAQAVLDSGITPVVVGLDVCHRTSLSKTQLDIIGTKSELGMFVEESCAGWLTAMEAAGWAGLHLFDSLAVAAALQPDLVSTEPVWMEIDTSQNATGGTSVAWLPNRPSGWTRPTEAVNAYVATDFDASRFKKLVEDRILTLL